MTEETKWSIGQVKAYLRSKGIPPVMLARIVATIVDSAIAEADNMKVDRIYTMVALMMHDVYDMDGEDILRGLTHLDELFGELSDADDITWHNEMERLDNECGLIIHAEDENRIIVEYGRPDTDEVTESESEQVSSDPN